MLPRGATRAFLATPLLLAALATACRERVTEPLIGFTYNWGEPGLVEFLNEEVARRTPAGATRVRVLAGPTGDWRSIASSTLAAEVVRALEFSDDPSVMVVVGPGGSREALQVAPVYRRARLAQLVPTATSRLLSTVGDWAFLMAPNDSLQGEFIGAFADTTLASRAATIFYAPDEYGIGLAAGVQASLVARGIKVIDRVPVRQNLDCAADAGFAEYTRLIAQVGRIGTPDVVVSATRPIETACLLRAMRAVWPSARLVAGDGAYVDSSFVARARVSTDGTYVVAFWHPSLDDPESSAFSEGFMRAVGRAPRHGDAIFYDAVLLAALAVREAGADREAIHAYLRGLGVSRSPYPGIAGPVGFGPESRRELLMTEVVDGIVRLRRRP